MKILEKKVISFDDVILVPQYSDITTRSVIDTSTEVQIGRKKVVLDIPIISSPMDTVTESDMAIKMALYGGIGIIHGNNTIEEQKNMVKQVKRYRNGIIRNPFQNLVNWRIIKYDRRFGKI